LIAGRDDLRDAYLDALEREVDAAFHAPEHAGRLELDTLFFGGGTPSHLTGTQLERLFALLRRRFCWNAGAAEISLEANPLDLDDAALARLAELGVNRLSIGVQSFEAAALRLLERDHSPEDVRKLMPRAQRWFGNVSVDLIFGVPGLALDSWRDTLRQAIDLGATHVSTYGLTFEPGTAFTTRRNRGELTASDEEQERAQYAAAMDDLAAAGFVQYEISNFARPGFECQHNLTYWRGGSYFGFGPGAARYVNGRRETNIRSTLGYLARLQRGLSPAAEVDELDAEGRARERIFLALRTTAGLSRRTFQQQTGYRLDELAADAIDRHQTAGWLEDDGDVIRLTREGRFVADRVMADFL
jgi:oxygen-independent coproporphyrinogen-3 oxidase